MREVKLTKACRRREKGAPMTVSDRAAFKMMELGEVAIDQEFMATFAKEHGIPFKIETKKPNPRKFKRGTEDK